MHGFSIIPSGALWQPITAKLQLYTKDDEHMANVHIRVPVFASYYCTEYITCSAQTHGCDAHFDMGHLTCIDHANYFSS